MVRSAVVVPREERWPDYAPGAGGPVELYPTEEIVGERTLQGFMLRMLVPLVARWLASKGTRAFTGSDQFIYYEPGNVGARVAPDVYVLPGVDPDADFGAWLIWEHGIRPSFALEIVSSDWLKDYADNPTRYDRAGVLEYIVFDPKPGRNPRRTRWQIWRRARDGELRMVERSQADRVRSTVLGCWLRAVGTGKHLRVRVATGARGDELFPTDAELAEAERARSEAARARAEQERARADGERARADAAEAELARLRAEMRRRGASARRRKS